jgi:hypothetical protein
MARKLKTGSELEAAMESVQRRISRATEWAAEDGHGYDQKTATLLAKQILEHLTEYVEDASPFVTEPQYGSRG